MSEKVVDTRNEQKGQETPYVHLFKTEENHFVLDLHTNKIFALDDQEATFFNEWTIGADFSAISAKYPEAAQSISLMRAEGLFCCERPSGLAFECTWEEIVEQILHKRERTTLEITQQCNLRCKYCTYGGGFEDHRNHSQKRMSMELLTKSIHAAVQHGSALDEIGFGFYGGEPLLAFDLIQAAVNIAKTEAPGKQLTFSITTNATLLDKKIAEFLKDSNFNVLVSLDGPQSMHDRYRVYPDGVGSYCNTTRGLRTLLDVFPQEAHGKIGLSMVVPSSDWFATLEELWETEPWIPQSIHTLVTGINPPAGMDMPAPPQSSVSLFDKWIDHAKTGGSSKAAVEKDIFDGSFAKLHQRPQSPSHRKYFFPNGCCIPGTRKIYVDAEGMYLLCERVHGAPNIGSIESGIDLQAIKKIIADYCSLSFQDCRDCSMISICTLCYMDAYKNGRFEPRKKRANCESCKKSLSLKLATYGRISQQCPHKLQEWEGYDIK
jgi:uncharacterized protein